jgi:hypothetical protein
MTEAKWLACKDPLKMLQGLPGQSSERRLRLFAAACCRGVWTSLRSEVQREIQVAEDYAEGKADTSDLDEARIAMSTLFGRWHYYGEQTLVFDLLAPSASEVANTWDSIQGRIYRVPAEARYGMKREDDRAEAAAQCALARCLFGGSFRWTSAPSTWRTRTIRALARAAVQERALPSGQLDPVRLGILADALEDAGCSEGALLGHLRDPGPHAWGCWPVDLVLGKE